MATTSERTQSREAAPGTKRQEDRRRRAAVLVEKAEKAAYGDRATTSPVLEQLETFEVLPDEEAAREAESLAGLRERFETAKRRRVGKRDYSTGRTLGRLMVYDGVMLYRRSYRGEPYAGVDREAVYATPCLSEKEHRAAFFQYLMLDSWLTDYRLRCETLLQQAQVQYKTLMTHLQRIVMSETLIRYVSKTRGPLAPDDPDLRHAEGLIDMTPFRGLLDPEDRVPRLALANSYRTFQDSYYFVAGFNYVIERVAEIHKLPIVIGLRRDQISELDDRIEVLNATNLVARESLEAPGAPDLAAQQRKLEAFNAYYPLLDRDDILEPRRGNEREADKLIRSFAGFGDYLSSPIGQYGPARLEALLFRRPVTKQPTEDCE